MLKSLQKHLGSFLKGAQFSNAAPMPHPNAFAPPNPSHPPLGLNMGQLAAGQVAKDDTSPGKSPAAAGSWHSPIQIPGQSPVGPPPGYMQTPMRENHYVMTPTHPHPQPGYPGPPNQPLGDPRGPPQHRRVMSDMSGGPPEEHPDVKRQRMFPAPPPGAFQQ